MHRKIFRVALVVLFFPFSSSADAQQTKKVPRIGFISARSGIESREETFRRGLLGLGYTEGKNIAIEWRFANGKADRLPDLAAESWSGPRLTLSSQAGLRPLRRRRR